MLIFLHNKKGKAKNVKYVNANISIFWSPNASLIKYRIFDIEINDTISVMICAWFFKWPFLPTLLGIFVRTGLNKILYS